MLLYTQTNHKHASKFSGMAKTPTFWITFFSDVTLEGEEDGVFLASDANDLQVGRRIDVADERFRQVDQLKESTRE